MPSSETATATLGISIARPFIRKMATTPTTSSVAMITVRSTSVSEARMVVVRSTATSILMSCGSALITAGSTAFTRSTVEMMLAPGWRLTCTMTAGEVIGLPFALWTKTPRLWMSSTPSVTSAMSDSRTAEP